MSKNFWSLGLLTLAGATAFAAACSSSGDEEDDGGTSSSDGGSATTTGTDGVGGAGLSTPASTGAIISVGGSSGEGGSGEGGGCVDIEVEPDAVLAPADVMIVFDTSGSMTEEATAVESNINASFAQILANSGLDYQVIVVSDFGSGNTDLCIEPPLAGPVNCQSDLVPAEVPNQFYHYHDQGDGVGITPDSFLEALVPHAGDDDGNHAGGLISLLRTDSIKHILSVSDDDPQGTNWGVTQDPLLSGPTGTNAFDFYTTILGTSPLHFGDQQNSRVVFHSIVGIMEKANPNEAYTSTELVVTPSGTAVQNMDCSTAVDPGIWYQMLAVGTGGIRYPVCNTNNYDAVFQEIATGVLNGAALPCEFALPAVKPQGYVEANLQIEFTPGSGPVETFEYGASSAACANNADFYVENDIIILCPDACMTVEADLQGAVDITAKCEEVPT
ncbi:MAG: hypothetical protein AAF715_01920 [Myxococcota bacterium]